MENNTYQAIIDKIITILNDTSLEDTVTAVINRLVSFGYTPVEEDEFAIAFSISKAKNCILNDINHASVPDGLFEVLVDMSVGEFLNAILLTGKLNLDSLDLDGTIASISEGDTTVSFNVDGSDESKVKSLISWLIGGKGCDLSCYRRIRW